MSIRSNWCEFDKETKKYIKKRDKETCVICGAKGATQIMHIFVNRSHGGKGDKRNGCLGCAKCHRIMDNPIGQIEFLKSKTYLDKCINYLLEVEHIENIGKLKEELKFKKEIQTISMPIEKKEEKIYNRCKECKSLIKTQNKYSSINSYYCKYRKIFINKTTKACKNFERY